MGLPKPSRSSRSSLTVRYHPAPNCPPPPPRAIVLLMTWKYAPVWMPFPQELKTLASRHPNLMIVALEVTDPASIKAAAARVEEHLKGSGLNLLINNAAILRLNTLESETPEDMSLVYATNVTGPLLVSQVPLTVDMSVRGILNLLPTLSEKDNGAFVDWEGKVLPW
ncbi:unnamed protein product [Caretta caretta]